MMPTPQRQDGLGESAMALTTLQRLALLRDQAQHRALSEEEQAELAEHHPSCIHCGGHHARSCPRVKRIVFNPGGGVHEVEYWPASEIDWTAVIFEDVGGDEEPVPDDRIIQDIRTVLNWAEGRDRSSSHVTEAIRRLVLWLDSVESQAVQSVHGQAAG